MLKKTLLLLAIVIPVIIFQSSAQTVHPPQLNLPNQVPPPPEAANLGKYGEIPVNMTAGVPNISIPLYEIKTPKLTLPIRLNYDATGIKVDQEASWVGLQWDLDAGGVITRTVNGLDDLILDGYYAEAVPPYAGNIVEGDQNTWTYLDQASLKTYPLIDTQPDYFFYNFAGYSGQFIFGEDKSIIDIHHQQPLKFQYWNTNGDYFTALDGEGNTYIFAARQQQSESYSYSSSTPIKQNDMNYTPAWYLSQIISCDQTDTITFNYVSDAIEYPWTKNFSIIYNSTNQVVYGNSQRVVSNSMVQAYNQNTPLRLQSITFKNGQINFYSSGPRNDVGENELDRIVVSRYDFVSKSYLPIKSIKLSYGYYQCPTTQRLRLDGVNITGAENENEGNYSFVYNSGQLPDVNDNGKDLFGYNNGASKNIGLVPKSSMTAQMQVDVGGADRNTYDSYLERGILTQINYPIGGYTKFTYEPNQYLTDASTQTISQEETATINTPHATWTFTPTVNTVASITIATSGFTGNPQGSIKVGVYENGTIIPGSGAKIDPVYGANQKTYINLIGGHNYTLEADCAVTTQNNDYATIIISYSQPNPNNPSVAGGGLRVVTMQNYDNNNNYLDGSLYKYGSGESGYGYLPISSTFFNTYNQTETFWEGKTADDGQGGLNCLTATPTYDVYNAASIYDCFNLSGQSISYDEVAKYSIDQAGNPLGKTIYDYTLYHTISVPGMQFTTPTITNTGYQGGQLLAQSDFAYKNSSYVPVKKVLYAYQTIPGPQARALKVERTMQSNGVCETPGISGTIHHRWEDVPISSGSILPISKTTYDYNTDNPANYVINYRTMAYNNSAHLQPVTTTEDMSDGTVLETDNQFPEEIGTIQNLTTEQSTALNQMTSMHNITPIIQQTISRSGVPVSILKNDYKVWSANHIYPSTVELQNGSSMIEKRVSYLNYDSNGNLLQWTKTNGSPVSSIWDYNGQHPIALTTNATQSDIAYTSFEADGSGNWTIPSTTRSPGGFTGHQSYSLSSGTISKGGLTSGTIYVVSYWTQNSGALTVTGTPVIGYPVKGPTINGWTYYEHRVTGQTALTVSGTGQIDDVRLYPSTAQMTTYTYDPLIGMTSSTDAKNKTTYYEYDSFQRLMNIKDKDGNILKHMDYHYQGQ